MEEDNTPKISVRHLDESDPTALLVRYQGQQRPQDAFLSLDLRDGTFTADWNGEIGNAVPMSVWHNTVLRWTIPTLATVAANALLDQLAPIAQRVLDGASIEWDGSNHVGRFDASALGAGDEIEQLCSSSWIDTADIAEYWSDENFRRENWPVRIDSTDEELEAIARDGEDSIRYSYEMPYLLAYDQLLDCLKDARQQLRDEAEDEEN